MSNASNMWHLLFEKWKNSNYAKKKKDILARLKTGGRNNQLCHPSGRKFVRSNTVAVIGVEKELCAKSARVVYNGRESLINQKNSTWSWAPRGREKVLPCQTETAWDLDCDKNGQKDEIGKRLSSTSDKTLLAHGLSSSPSSKENCSQPDYDSSFKWKYKLPQLSHRASIREKSSSGSNVENRRKALRQRSMSLDAAEELWLSAAVEPKSDDKLPSRKSPNLSEKMTKSRRSIENVPKRSNHMSGSSIRNRKLILAPDGETVLRHKKKRSTTSLLELFHAVERQNVDRVREILEDCNALDINSTNSDELTLLDIAVLLNNVAMVQLLLSYGARENARYQKSSDVLEKRLQSLHCTAKNKAVELKALVTVGQTKDTEALLRNWEFREKLSSRMLAVFESVDCPSEPTAVQLIVASSSSLLVTFDEPLSNGSIVTRYKVEWSTSETFQSLVGEQIIDDPQYKQYEILDLLQADVYYVRVRAANFKGFGKPALTNPTSAMPSNWKELDDFRPRWDGKLRHLDELFTNIKNSRPPDAPELEGSGEAMLYSGSSLHFTGRKSTVKKSIKNLFSSSPKFQKTLKRGVYLAALVSSEDRILVTNEDFIPVIEVDENFIASTLNSDYHWLMKIACTWKDVRSLRQDLEKSSSPGAMQFRYRLLQAISNLQLALGLQDLGQFYHQPVKDANGTIILAAINYLPSTKSVNISQHVKWTSLGKVQRRSTSAADADALALDVLIDVTGDLVKYHCANSTVLPKGLYLGYLKLQSSVELIHIMVPMSTPNVLPCIKLRDCPNVAREEWEWLRSLGSNKVICSPNAVQLAFHNSLVEGCKKLLHDLEIGEDEAISHRLYDIEVIEFSADVSFILLLPDASNVCAVPGHTEEMNPGCIVLPVQVFEMVHMRTYQFDFISRYSRLSSILEIDQHLAQQAFRQAFSSDELTAAKQRLDQLGQFQQKLDEAWKAMRWTMDIITYARDKSLHGGLPLGVLFALPPTPGVSPSPSQHQLEICPNNGSSSPSIDYGYQSDRSTSAMESQLAGSSDVTDEVQTEMSAVREALQNYISAEGKCVNAEAQSGTLRIFASCCAGLNKGTSVKLRVAPQTTAEEIVSLVVHQLTRVSRSDCGLENGAADFCLVLAVGTREHALCDDFQPLQLQNPWTRGRLCLRQKLPNADSTVANFQMESS